MLIQWWQRTGPPITPVWPPVVLVWVVAWPGAPPIMWCSVVVVVPSPPVWPPCSSLLPKFLILQQHNRL